MKFNYRARLNGRGIRSPRHNGLSWPTLGGCWKNKATGQYYEVVGSFPVIVLRERIENPGDLVKLTDLEAFYENFVYTGRIKVHDE